jgi:protein-S-isoprenylcysteine O-methyltransferase Ste14
VSRLSRGRNIGFVPAQREIVTAGAYRYVRHPIYTGLILSYLAVAVRIYSPRTRGSPHVRYGFYGDCRF